MLINLSKKPFNFNTQCVYCGKKGDITLLGNGVGRFNDYGLDQRYGYCKDNCLEKMYPLSSVEAKAIFYKTTGVKL